MLLVDIKSLVARLNSYCKNALENAAGLCLERGHWEITVEHFAYSLLQESRSEMNLLLPRVGLDVSGLLGALSVDIGKIESQRTASLGFSPLIFDLLQDAWLIASVELGRHAIHSGAILLALAQRGRNFAQGEWPDRLRLLGRDHTAASLREVSGQSCEAEAMPSPGGRGVLPTVAEQEGARPWRATASISLSGLLPAPSIR
ncbi:hypothetical protein OMK73_37170 [Cupriavidus sp. D39]|nr:Clp protease N-terminal domain-containing protein [Cupriavidus sp. D39]MCY0858664.1 hypothetical protein [Cupriavidus sp. D39]